MIEGNDGHHYVTATGVRDQDGYADITPALLRQWVADGKLARVTRGELAAAFGVPMPAGDDPDDPARVRGCSGPENVYRWADVVRVETATRRTPAGRHRTRAPRDTPPLPAAA